MLFAMTSKEPDVSAEDLETQFSAAAVDFDRAMRKGDAIARISDLTEKVLKELGSGAG